MFCSGASRPKSNYFARLNISIFPCLLAMADVAPVAPQLISRWGYFQTWILCNHTGHAGL